MSGEKFDSLVASLEDLSRRDPVGYKIRVALLALLPYVYLGVVIILALLFIGLICRLFLHASAIFISLLRIALPIAALLFVLCRAFMVRFPPPTGVPVSAADSPKIFELLNELKSKLDCPKIDAVYLNADFNASIRTLPRFGLLGASRHYLCLGLPLMQSLPPEQFRAVLAHELGHLSANHGRFASWIYSVRTNANQLLEVIRSQAPFGSFLFKHFLEWYSPFFSAYSFVLVRQHEYEADKCAAEISGATTAALSLINTEIKNKYVDLKYWKELFKHVDECPEPPSAPFHDLSELMVRSGMDPDV
ncbi:MAG: M48 family metallopeptidase, partial [Candidatus Obscuribacterales bacterium]|nr:M48 family metallopeptidase [Candidatus Obscuribacterales bacterium]